MLPPQMMFDRYLFDVYANRPALSTTLCTPCVVLMSQFDVTVSRQKVGVRAEFVLGLQVVGVSQLGG